MLDILGFGNAVKDPLITTEMAKAVWLESITTTLAAECKKICFLFTLKYFVVHTHDEC